jgi:aminoglycoside phosphotransferase (APT) family kinase protein
MLPFISRPNDGFVRVPAVLNYDSEAHVLRMEDGGPRNLKEAYSDESVDAIQVGTGLGKWIAQLHASTVDPVLRKKFDSQIAKTIYRHSSKNLQSALTEYGYDSSLGERINATFGSLLQSDDVSVCHGDFWPGNILLSDTTISSEETAPPPLVLTVVDWEMTRNGFGVTDIGQFSAEAWLLDRFRGDRGLLDAFLKGYLAERGAPLGREEQRRVAIHFGTHIAYWPTRVEWGTKEETKDVVKIGVEMLEHAESGDWDWLKESVLGILFT